MKIDWNIRVWIFEFKNPTFEKIKLAKFTSTFFLDVKYFSHVNFSRTDYHHQIRHVVRQYLLKVLWPVEIGKVRIYFFIYTSLLSTHRYTISGFKYRRYYRLGFEFQQLLVEAFHPDMFLGGRIYLTINFLFTFQALFIRKIFVHPAV